MDLDTMFGTTENEPEMPTSLQDACAKAGVDCELLNDPVSQRRLQNRLAQKIKRRSKNLTRGELDLCCLMTKGGCKFADETDQEEQERLQKKRLLQQRHNTPNKRAARLAAETPSACLQRQEMDRLRHGVRETHWGEKFEAAQERMQQLRTFSRCNKPTACLSPEEIKARLEHRRAKATESRDLKRAKEEEEKKEFERAPDHEKLKASEEHLKKLQGEFRALVNSFRGQESEKTCSCDKRLSVTWRDHCHWKPCPESLEKDETSFVEVKHSRSRFFSANVLQVPHQDEAVEQADSPD